MDNKSKEAHEVAGYSRTNGKDRLPSTSVQFLGGEKEWGVMKKSRSRGTWEGMKFQRVGRAEKKPQRKPVCLLIWKTGKMLITIL